MLGARARVRTFEAGGEVGEGGAGFGMDGGDKKSYGVMAVDGGKHLRSAKWQHTEVVLGGGGKVGKKNLLSPVKS